MSFRERFAWKNKHVVFFFFDEHYREVNHLTHSSSSKVKFLLPSNLPSILCLAPDLLRS